VPEVYGDECNVSKRTLLMLQRGLHMANQQCPTYTDEYDVPIRALNMLKRALNMLKRALNMLKRALNMLKRALNMLKRA